MSVVTPKCYPSDTQVVTKWHPNDTYVVLNLTQVVPKVGMAKRAPGIHNNNRILGILWTSNAPSLFFLATSWSLECYSLYHGTFCDPYFQPQKIPWDMRAACSLKKLPNVPDFKFCLALCAGTEVMERYLVICPFAPCTVCTLLDEWAATL